MLRGSCWRGSPLCAGQRVSSQEGEYEVGGEHDRWRVFMLISWMQTHTQVRFVMYSYCRRDSPDLRVEDGMVQLLSVRCRCSSSLLFSLLLPGFRHSLARASVFISSQYSFPSEPSVYSIVHILQVPGAAPFSSDSGSST